MYESGSRFMEAVIDADLFWYIDWAGVSFSGAELLPFRKEEESGFRVFCRDGEAFVVAYLEDGGEERVRLIDGPDSPETYLDDEAALQRSPQPLDPTLLLRSSCGVFTDRKSVV